MRGNRKIIQAAAAGLAFVLICSMTPVQNFIAAPVEETENTTEEVIKINTVEDFITFTKQCYLDSWSVGKLVVLEQDIDLTGIEFEMIPLFSGTFDGKDHTISGFHSVGDGYVGGLFRYIGQSGTVKNLKLKGDVDDTEEKECIGSICGINYGTIQNCSFEGTISGKDTVGGIAGTNAATGFINDCEIHGHVIGYYMTGGIVGNNHGSVSRCSNYSGINDDSEWVEEDDEMDTGILASINNSDSELEFYSGVDTGGIAGYSNGTISNCTNYGKVGYEHTGYNIGGIAGRQAGVISFCENNGEIYGRKDIGGIVGQMEPAIEVDEAESLRNAVDKLHNLIGRTLDDLQAGKNAAKTDLDNLSVYGDAAFSSGHELADQLSDFAGTNIDQIHELDTRMDYVMNQLPDVVDDLSAAGDAFRSFSELLDQAMKDMDDGDWPDIRDEYDWSEAVDDLEESTGQLDQSASNIHQIILDDNGYVKEWSTLNSQQQAALIREVSGLADDTRKTEDAAKKALSGLSGMNTSIFSDEMREDLEDAIDSLQSMADALGNAGNRAKDIVNYLNNQPEISFVALGKEFDQSRENLYGQMQGIADSLKSLGQNMSAYSDQVNEDLNAVNDQLNIVFHLLMDNLSGAGFSVEELYEEVSDDEIDSIITGRTDSCKNNGVVKGDINIGGITGSMAIDEEDPEDNAAGSINYEIGRRFIMKCIVQDCVNEGNVTAKKDGAGGIAGYMAHGIVIHDENYGSVESTEGDYVGGICGQSLTVIRECYSLCDVSGGKNVGGIAGYANTLEDCYAIVNAEASAGRKGAIAGEVAEPITGNLETKASTEANVNRNYYVDDVLYGIDNISYIGIAEPISYQDILAVEGIPGEFRHLKVIYVVDDVRLGSEEVAYGGSLANLNYPEFPAKEGCYGVWPDYSDDVMTGNLIIHGEYHDNVRVVESDKTGTEKPYALVEQIFTEDTVLNVSESSIQPPQQAAGKIYVMYEVSLENSNIGSGDVFPIRLLNPYEDAEVWGWYNDRWIPLESKARGEYLQVDMTGTQETFCIVETQSYTSIILVGVVVAAVVLVILIVLSKKLGKKKQVRSKK